MKAIQKKRAALVLLCLLIMLTPIVSQAQQSEIVQPWAVYILDSDASLSISDKGVASVSGYVISKSGTASTSVRLTLQVKSGSVWLSTKSWLKNSSGPSTFASETYSVPKGTYRVVATVKANTESKTITTASKTY